MSTELNLLPLLFIMSAIILLNAIIGFLLLLPAVVDLAADHRGRNDVSSDSGGKNNKTDISHPNSRLGILTLSHGHLVTTGATRSPTTAATTDTISTTTIASSLTSAYPHPVAIAHRHPHPHNIHSYTTTNSPTPLPFFLSKGKREIISTSTEDDLLLEPVYLASSSSSSSGGRIVGPYFESNNTTISIVARAGQNVLFDCAVILLQGRTVSWLRKRYDTLQLLTVGNQTYNGDSRVGLRFRYPNNWRLGISSVSKGDEGEYQCQLSTHPIRALIFHLKVIAPAVQIFDENGHVVTERHYKEDSSLHLTCKASHVDKLQDHVMWLKGERTLPGGDSRIKVKQLKNSTTGEASAFLSVLSVRKGDSGNYTCRASSLASNTIAVHVLNGELPAAVQHENSANVLVGCYLSRGLGLVTWLVLLISLLPSILHTPPHIIPLTPPTSS